MGKQENSNSKKEKGSRGGGGRVPSDGTMGAPIADERFSRLHTDPRFQRLPKNKAKVAIDSRFAHMFTEKGFSNPSHNKRGVRLKSSSKTIDPLRRYYRVDDEAAEEDEHEAGDGCAEIEPKKEGGKKDGAKKTMEKLPAKGQEEIDSADELWASTSKTDVSSTVRKRRGKKDRIKKLEAQIAQAEVHSEGTEELEEVDEVNGEQDQGAKVSTGAVGILESDEDFEDEDDASGLQEGQDDSEEEEDDEQGSSSSSSSSDSESDVELEISGAEEEEKIPTTQDETRRLAIVNMDWEHIRAVHLLVLMRSFAPKGGSVYSVTVYPSEFGTEQMEEENVHGPKGIFKKNEDEDDEDEEEADPEKLRKYEKAKLRYFYAVVECDSASTAAHVYKNCDGLEFERTSNTLDLRFIPDEMEFKRDPRDSASEVPVDYKPIEFETRALQHSNVKLTWDDDEPVRVRALRRNFNRDELNEMDFRAYVASSSESESESEPEALDEAAEIGNGVDRDDSIGAAVPGGKKEKVRSKYLALLAGAEEADSVRGKKAEKGNIEIKFHTGLDELSEKLLAKTKKDRTDETVWEAYLRRKKEKKNARKNKKSAADSDVSSDDEAMHSDGGEDQKDDPFFSHGNEDPFDDPFFNQDSGSELPAKARAGRAGKEGKVKDLNRSKKEEERQRKKDDAAREKKETEKKQAELELLLLDDHMVQNGEIEVPQASNMDDTGRKQKVDKKKKKGSKGKVEELQKKIASNANYDDPRFSSLFTSHLYALDPTDPQFKKTGAQVVEMQRRHFQSSKVAQEQLDTNDNPDLEEGRIRKRKAEVSSLVRSLKSKVQAEALRVGRR